MTTAVADLPPWADPHHHVSKRQAQTIRALRARLSLAVTMLEATHKTLQIAANDPNVIRFRELIDACKEPS